MAAVVIATPTSTHFDLVKRCLEAGRHVLVEKPLTDGSRAAAEVCRLAEEKRLTLMVGHVFLFNPAIRAAKDLIDAKELGTVYYASMVRTNLGPVRGDVNAAWDLASHDISIANFWFESQPLSVSARGGSWLNTGVDDVSFATIQYPGDVLVHIHASWLHPRKARDLVVVGSEKMITVNDMDLSEPLRIYDKGVHAERPIADTFASFRATIREGSITIPSVALGEPLRSECDEFINRVLGAEGSLSDGRAGLSVVRALEALSLSAARRGAEVSLEEVD